MSKSGLFYEPGHHSLLEKIEKKKALIFVGYSWVCAVSLIYCRSCVGEFAHPLKFCCDSKCMAFAWLFVGVEKRSDKSPAKRGGSI